MNHLIEPITSSNVLSWIFWHLKLLIHKNYNQFSILQYELNLLIPLWFLGVKKGEGGRGCKWGKW